jgi:hypothetical protein
MSTAMLDEDAARDGVQVANRWGEEGRGTARHAVERHSRTTIRATVGTRPLVR